MHAVAAAARSSTIRPFRAASNITVRDVAEIPAKDSGKIP
jgi:hypothetical protein